MKVLSKIMEKSISQQIIELRRAAELTQEQLGEQLEISGQDVSKRERWVSHN